MKIPRALEPLLNASAAGGRLRDVVVAAEDQSEIAAVVRLVAEALDESTKGAVQESCAPTVDLTTACSIIEELHFLHPRGKQMLAFFRDRLVIKTKAKQFITVMAADIEDVVVLDSIPKDQKNRVLIMLNFREDAGIKNGNTRMRACVIQVTGDQQLDIQHPKDASKRLSGIAAVVICQAIGTFFKPGVADTAAFHGSDAKIFRSCTDTAAVEAYVKARNGFLFPLQHGLCFLESPPIFIHTGKIRSVDFARANGASATFDFQVHLRNGAIEEFSNISRHELSCIQNWVDTLRLPVGFPETSGSDQGGPDGEAAAGDEASSDDASDEDFDPYTKRAKIQKVEEDNSGAESSLGEFTSDDDDDGDGDCELVDEEDMKLSDLRKHLETEKETKRMDISKTVETQGTVANSAGEGYVRTDTRKGNGGSDGERDESDESDEDFDVEQDSDCDSGNNSGDDSSDGECELVDEADMKLSHLQKQLEAEKSNPS